MEPYTEIHTGFILASFLIIAVVYFAGYVWHIRQKRKTYSLSTADHHDLGRRIVCSANRIKKGDGTYAMVLGARHWDPLMREAVEVREKAFPEEVWTEAEQGFIDQRGVFLTREQGLALALKTHQILRRCGGDELRLFSENLY